MTQAQQPQQQPPIRPRHYQPNPAEVEIIALLQEIHAQLATDREHNSAFQVETRRALRGLTEGMDRMTTDQEHLNADVDAIVAALTQANDGLTNIAQEIADLKSNPAAAGVDFTNLDNLVNQVQTLTASITGLAPASSGDQPVDPNAPTP